MNPETVSSEMNDVLTSTSQYGVVGILVAIVLFLLFFIVTRELYCWYFKINKITALLQEISDKLGKR